MRILVAMAAIVVVIILLAWLGLRVKARILWITRNVEGRNIEGTKLSAVGSATWLDQGKPWAVFSLEDVVYNVDVSEYIRQKGR